MRRWMDGETRMVELDGTVMSAFPHQSYYGNEPSGRCASVLWGTRRMDGGGVKTVFVANLGRNRMDGSGRTDWLRQLELDDEERALACALAYLKTGEGVAG